MWSTVLPPAWPPMFWKTSSFVTVLCSLNYCTALLFNCWPFPLPPAEWWNGGEGNLEPLQSMIRQPLNSMAVGWSQTGRHCCITSAFSPGHHQATNNPSTAGPAEYPPDRRIYFSGQEVSWAEVRWHHSLIMTLTVTGAVLQTAGNLQYSRNIKIATHWAWPTKDGSPNNKDLGSSSYWLSELIRKQTGPGWNYQFFLSDVEEGEGYMLHIVCIMYLQTYDVIQRDILFRPM